LLDSLLQEIFEKQNLSVSESCCGNEKD